MRLRRVKLATPICRAGTLAGEKRDIAESLQLSVAHRFSGGLYWQSAYTWAKSIDDVSTATVAFDTRINDQTNARASYTAHLWRGVYVAPGLQHIVNPGYNRDRGPVLVPSLRLHLEF